jgi:class 3 adenylate cyclase/tetratricopeptide (TPR) repeat protein
VTVLFCDVVGSTAMGESVDPEALQGLLARYFERMKAIIESHGGAVEKFIGDAVMAVFGVPVAHEDDALRACRAAVEMREALPELGVEGRIGVNTGEVLTGTEERLAAGDAVNVAARLEQVAEPGEVLIPAATLALVRDAVEIGEERLLELKGKSESVAAYPLRGVREVAERSHASLFVGRQLELQQLVAAWERTLAGQGCELVTVVGDPGVGKSRLVAEALAKIDARVVRGRCLSYGEGITYWPVVEVVKQLDAVPSDEQAASAIRSLLRESESVAGIDEIAWAFRKLLEEQAPLVVCFDDIQWGEETFLELVESIALLSTSGPLLLLCMARPELLDRRPGWPAVLRLEPLPDEDAGALVGDAMPDDLRQQIIRASGGNPLFLTEMVALRDEQGGDVELPATLRALLAARLDQLDESERRVLERGAVEGELFHRGAVQALAPEEDEVTPRLAALVRRDLVRPDRPVLPREDAFRFRHLLIRDAAYDAPPKATRADLHRRFAAWLEEQGRSLVEVDEILGYHLEQAASYLDELGRPDPEVALAAGDRLAAAGRQAVWRGDRRAAVRMFERSLGLSRPLRFDVHLELDLVWSMSESHDAVAIAAAAADRAEAEGDKAAELLARALVADYCLSLGEASVDEAERLAEAALPPLEAARDHRGLLRVWNTLSGIASMRCRFDAAARAAEQAIAHARALGPDPRLFRLPHALICGSRPAGECLETLDALQLEHSARAPLEVGIRAVMLAMLDRFDEAWADVTAAADRLREFGDEMPPIGPADLAELAGDHALAAAHYRIACDWLEAQGLQAPLATYAPAHGRHLVALGRYEEAERLAEQGRALGAPDDVDAQIRWRQVQALVLAHRRDYVDAERLAREAVAIADGTDMLRLQGDAYCDLGEVLEVAGRREEAFAAWRMALDRYERKGIIPLARRIRERLASRQPA